MSEAGERRWRDRSLWLDSLPGPLAARPPLPGDRECDVAIVGAGFTGLWTAYYLATLAPQLRVAVVEREIAGFGASGRNGGWVSAGIAGDGARYARRAGAEAVRAAEQETYRTVDEVGRVVAAEGIECAYRKGGQLMVAATAAQLQRLHALVARRRAFGARDDDLQMLGRAEVARRVRFEGALAAWYSPHCARIDPARLVRGLAEAVERRGVTVYEQTAALRLEPGRVETDRGVLRADSVVRATEAFTIQLPGERRRYLPLYSLMIATEPLGPEVWEAMGWDGGETVGDLRHLFFYAQRTADDRIAIGGRGAPYRLGSPIDQRHERYPAVAERLHATIRRHFPAAGGARITHHWGGALGVPRDWCHGVGYDRASGLAWAGGYTGHGLAAANLAGRTLADLLLDRDTELRRLPWIDHRSRRWEPEPLRFVASRAIVRVMGSADGAEEELGHTARRMRLIAPFLP